MIDVQHLTKSYGDFRAVDDISFNVGEGEIVGFLGPNGAGKTTTMRILTGFMPATAGTVKIAGYDVFTESLKVKENIGYLPESNPLYPEMRAVEYLHFRAKLKNVPRNIRKQRIEETLARCGASEFADKVLGTLSKGQRQRIGLADCLLHNPKILILDEPTVGLDPNQIRHVRTLIKELSSAHTVLISTHILPEVESVCERFIIINHGKIACQMSMDELRNTPYLNVEASAPKNELVSALEGIAGVKNVQATDSGEASRVTVELADSSDRRAEIFELVKQHGWQLLELSQRALTLEEVFARTTLHETPAAAEGEVK